MSWGFDLFSDFFARRDNVVQRLDSRVKLAVTLGGIGAVLFSSLPLLPVMVCFLVLSSLLGLKIPLRFLVRRFLPAAGITLMILLLHGFMIGSDPLLTFGLGGWELTLYQDGFHRGMLAGSRVLGAFSLLLMLGFVTPAHDIFRALHWFRMPKEWVEIALMTYRYIFVLLDDASDMATAQKIRLGYVGFKRSLASMGALVGSVLVRSLDQSVRTHEAMTARAYTGEMPFVPMGRLGLKAAGGIVLAFAVTALAYLASEGWGR
ncbi:MAG: cobalt ECF transporter T component CbiQ [Desulfobacteraceae bacterium]|nr:MAG: cobalt ECF transporter T component CbiQ [Desulfobacteraceae bacterium]